MRYCCWNFVSTPMPKSPGRPILNTVFGSKIARGRKNFRNMRRLVTRKPATEVQIIVRRNLLTSSATGELWTTLVRAPAEVPTAGLDGLAGAGFSGFAFSTGAVASDF